MTLRFNFVVPAKQVRPGHLFDQSLNHGGPQSPVPLPPSPPSGAPGQTPSFQPACRWGVRWKGAGRRCAPPTARRRPATSGEAA